MRHLIDRLLGAPHWPSVGLTYALGLAGGFGAQALHLPLPMLLGSLLAVGAAAVGGLKPFGHLPQAPQKIRMVFVPVIGIAIGGAARPEILAEAPRWVPSLLALCLFIPLVHFLGFRLLTATGRVDRRTAFYGTAPGGLVETVQMGEEAGADVQMLAMLQFLRLILTIVLVPVAFSWMEGHAVGSAAGAAVAGSALGVRDVAVLAVAAVAGALIGLKLRLPAGHVLGPILLSAAAHMAGWTEGVPPGWLLAAAQVVVGTSLGVRFAGMPKGRILAALRLALMNAVITIGTAVGFALALAPLTGEPVRAVFLAFAPGGLIEMGLIALSLKMSILYVTAHHLVRIILAVSFVRAFGGRME
ncbi:AbrB family transcriptional regulator [Defluviimonas sp. WL0024]|uniref:AbrB family transcriptional regulator n=1 Tax=Albidovulum salinarum TaxID=2984153 RepID=A0ABT2X521_9RHOB|nr:AbrB family transcriptional regulator [Defluviimonas sp. WL0024]MCU9849026.1 AbrB family transcriptional regulator [Defluviimonas sp. WL0024]